MRRVGSRGTGFQLVLAASVLARPRVEDGTTCVPHSSRPFSSREGWVVKIVAITLLTILTSCGGGGGGSSSFVPQTPPTPTPPPPVAVSVTTRNLPDAFVGTPYSTTLTATGGSGKYLWSASSFFYPGLTFDANTATIAGTPTAAGGSPAFIVTVQDANALANSGTFQINFRALQKFTFQTTSFPNAHLNVPYSGTVNAQPGVSSAQLVSGSLPPGLSLSTNFMSQTNPVSLQGTPAATGTFNFTVNAASTDNPPQTLTQALSVTVDNNVGITTATMPDGILNAPYAAQFAATGGQPPYHWSGVNLFNGQQIDPVTGLFTATGVYGVNFVQIAVTDSSNPPQQDTRNFAFTSYGALSLFQPNPLIIGKNINQPLTPVGGGKPPYNFSLISGSLPPGLALNNWILSGIPTQIGTYPITLKVTDSANPPQVAQSVLDLTVTPTTLTATPSWQVQTPLPIGIPFDGYVIVQGGTPPYQMRTGVGRLPQGFSFDPNTGHFSGNTTQVGDFWDTVIVTDSSQPQMTARATVDFRMVPPRHRNDSIANATLIGDVFNFGASISPYADPQHPSTPAPDQDYYHLIASPSANVRVTVGAVTPALFPVLEILDANGNRLQTCFDQNNVPHQTCLGSNGPVPWSLTALALQVPPSAPPQTDLFLHVLDWRGDARPDMLYSMSVTGVVDVLNVSNNPAETSLAQNVGGSFYLSASGGTGSISWSVQSGSLPPGVTLNAGGNYVTGTPTTLGSYNVVFKATDSSNPPLTATVPMQIDVLPPLTINPVTLPHLKVGVPFSYQFTVSGGSNSLIFWNFFPTFQASPSFIQNENGGFLQLTPLQAGNFQLSVNVSQFPPNSNTTITVPVTIDP